MILNKLKSLQVKVLLISICFFGLFSVINLLVEYYIVYPSFLSLEEIEAKKNLSRAAEAILNNISHLSNTCHDWAAWDDSYDFIGTKSGRFIETNLGKSTFENNEIHLLYFFDTKGEIAWGEAYSDKYDSLIHLTELSQGRLSLSHPFFSYDTDKTPLSQSCFKGLWMSEFGPMMIASLPILTSDNEGPVAGTIVMGRFLSATLVRNLSAQLQVPFEIKRYDSGEIPLTAHDYEKLATGESPVLLSQQDEKQLSAYTVLSDVFGQPSVILKANTKKDISAKGITAIRFAMFSNFAGLIGILMVFVLILQQTVLKPITRLKDYILNFGASGIFAPRLTVNRKDEIGTLGMEFDKLLFQLKLKASELASLNQRLTHDIEMRIAAEEELSRARAFLSAAFEQSPAGIVIAGASDANIHLVNSAALKILRNSPRNQEDFADTLHPSKWQLFYSDGSAYSPEEDPLTRAVIRGDIAMNEEMLLHCATGENKWLLANASPIRGNKGEEIVAGIIVFLDISELKHAQQALRTSEERLARSQKMEALGLLAGGVAHDLNNVLSAITTYPELLLLDLPKKSRIRKPLQTIQKSGQKAAEIVQDLLALARRGVMNTQVLNLNSIISEYLTSPEYEKLMTFHPGIELRVSLSEDLHNIRGGPIHLRKSLMNLVSNAAEAQLSGGLIAISTRNQYLDKPIRGNDRVVPGDYVVLTVSDNGIGIHHEDIARIFEPFYTKKVMGRSGTGLGMAVVWGTVQDHNGYIDIESTEGNGTTFSLYFPISREPIPFSDTFRIQEFQGAGKSVLVADDIEEQRLIAFEILTKAGYRVETVSSGEETLQYLSKTSVDLVVLDMIMQSGMDGLSTFLNILEMHPRQRVIIASGFSETDRVKQALQHGAMAFIQKPYTLEKILRTAATALEKGYR